MSRIVVWPVLAGVVTTSVLILWRNFFWQHALIIGIAAVALVYTAIRTVERLKDIHRH